MWTFTSAVVIAFVLAALYIRQRNSGPGPPYERSGIRTPNGRWLVRFAAAASENLRAVDRTELRGVLLDSLTAGTVHWGQRVSART